MTGISSSAPPCTAASVAVTLTIRLISNTSGAIAASRGSWSLRVNPISQNWSSTNSSRGIVVASMMGSVSVEAMALIIAALAWMWPARAVRAQVLTIRERMYVQVARFNGTSNLRIIIGELLPNLMPYLAATLVGAISGAILASVGLSTLGLGPVTRPSLGLTFYWAITYGALIRAMWWWFMPPIVIIVILFLGLFLMSQGLDQIANPRLQIKA